MGSFSNTIFRILLGWIQAIVSVIWSAFTAQGGESLFQYIGRNWIGIVITLCAAGTVTDFVIYLFRWKPYKVWGTFWRHLRKKESENLTENKETVTKVPDSEYESRFTNRNNERDDLYRWRETTATEEKPEDHRDEITRAGYVVPADSPYRRPETGSELTDNQDRDSIGTPRRRRNRFTGILGETSEEERYRYFAPQPVIDRKDAYRPPVYPERWKDNGGEES